MQSCMISDLISLEKGLIISWFLGVCSQKWILCDVTDVLISEAT